MRVVYNGHEALTFNDYLDLASGRTLRAEPGHGVYDIIPAAGHVVPDFPSPWFAALEWEPVPEPEPAQEPQAESEQGPEPEHGTDEGQSF